MAGNTQNFELLPFLLNWLHCKSRTVPSKFDSSDRIYQSFEPAGYFYHKRGAKQETNNVNMVLQLHTPLGWYGGCSLFPELEWSLHEWVEGDANWSISIIINSPTNEKELLDATTKCHPLLLVGHTSIIVVGWRHSPNWTLHLFQKKQ